MALLAVVVGYAGLALARRSPLAGSVNTPDPSPGENVIPDGRPTVIYRSTALDATYGAVVIGTLPSIGQSRWVSALQCDRVYFAAGRGICLAVDRGVVTTARALVFDDRLRPVHQIPLNGIPSRVRLSPDGKRGAATTFVAGHSYAGGSFSTETVLMDLSLGSSLGTLEEFAIWRDGERIQAADANLWGVSFARDGDRFYATLATGGRTFLVVGSVGGRSVRVIHQDVECPSLSPDESRVAFKRRVHGAGPIHWQPYVLDLATGAETPLAEARSIDDQIEWLDDRRLLYALPERSPSAVTHIWMLRADGAGQPELFLEQAASPAVIRDAAGAAEIGGRASFGSATISSARTGR